MIKADSSFSRPRRGRPAKDRRLFLHVAVSVDFRGPNDDQLFFLFRDPPRFLLSSVFRVLIAGGKGIAQQAVISQEHDIVRRMGKGYWRTAVALINPNFNLCSLESMKLLIESNLKRLHPCKIQWMSIDKFLNV